MKFLRAFDPPYARGKLRILRDVVRLRRLLGDFAPKCSSTEHLKQRRDLRPGAGSGPEEADRDQASANASGAIAPFFVVDCRSRVPAPSGFNDGLQRRVGRLSLENRFAHSGLATRIGRSPGRRGAVTDGIAWLRTDCTVAMTSSADAPLPVPRLNARHEGDQALRSLNNIMTRRALCQYCCIDPSTGRTPGFKIRRRAKRIASLEKTNKQACGASYTLWLESMMA
jgi:hypothetical protein